MPLISAGHQHRDGHVPEDIAGHPAQDRPAQARVTIGSYDDEVGTDVGRARKQHFRYGEIVGGKDFRPDLDSPPQGVRPDRRLRAPLRLPD